MAEAPIGRHSSKNDTANQFTSCHGNNRNLKGNFMHPRSFTLISGSATGPISNDIATSETGTQLAIYDPYR